MSGLFVTYVSVLPSEAPLFIDRQSLTDLYWEAFRTKFHLLLLDSATRIHCIIDSDIRDLGVFRLYGFRRDKWLEQIHAYHTTHCVDTIMESGFSFRRCTRNRTAHPCIALRRTANPLMEVHGGQPACSLPHADRECPPSLIQRKWLPSAERSGNSWVSTFID